MTDYFEMRYLEDEVEIHVDEWGVPHIFGSSKNDVFLAQGFNAARDRLFQLDFSRRRGLGRLAEVFGSEFVEWDRAARLFIYRGDFRAEWLAYGNDAKAIVTSFVNGVNGFIDLVVSGAMPLPLEFEKLGYLPEKWAPEDLLRLRSHSLSFNAAEEAIRARLAHEWGHSIASLRKLFEPAVEFEVPEGLDFSVFAEDVMKDYWLGTGPLVRSENSNSGIGRVHQPSDGSNNWVLSGDLTSTGRPILCNDPHRVTSSMPSLRYIAHLSCRDFDVIGGGEPLLPGVSIGHNGKVAFGLTIFAIDQEDLFVHVLNPNNPDEYQFEGAWRKFSEVTEEIHSCDGPEQTVVLRFSEFGPVIYHDPERHVAVSLAAAWLEPGGAPYLGSIEYMRADNIDEFLEAMNRWCAPPENQIVAEPGGRIAWQPGGIIPKRKNWNGLFPIPGDGRYVWDGFYDNDVLPGFAKDSGYFATANQYLLPEEFPREVHISYEWYDDVRYRRIKEWLDDAREITIREAFDFQTDDLNLHARETIVVLKQVAQFQDHALGRLVDAWDFRMSVGSTQAHAWELFFWEHLVPAVLRSQLKTLGYEGESEKILGILIPDLAAERDSRVALSLMRDWADSDQRKLDLAVEHALISFDAFVDMDKLCPWGDVHMRYADHAFADLLIEAGVEEKLVRSGEYEVPGSGETVGLAGYASTGDYRQIYGSSFRVAIDVGEWDNSIALNGPGQSGDLSSGYQFEHMDRWAKGEPFPLLYSKGLIEKHRRQLIILKPR
ncbi:penicillin acylase family protein [Corynebacterium coyleae]